MDLITNPEFTSNAGTVAPAESVDEEIGPEDRLDGETVRAIWKLSRLERITLRVIWSVPACCSGMPRRAGADDLIMQGGMRPGGHGFSGSRGLREGDVAN